jgi:hypothetical protein
MKLNPLEKDPLELKRNPRTVLVKPEGNPLHVRAEAEEPGSRFQSFRRCVAEPEASGVGSKTHEQEFGCASTNVPTNPGKQPL